MFYIVAEYSSPNICSIFSKSNFSAIKELVFWIIIYMFKRAAPLESLDMDTLEPVLWGR